MKYVVAWEPRPNASEGAGPILAARRRVVTNRGQYLLAFLGRVDGHGDFSLVETEDVASIARDGAIFNVFFHFNVYPVVDVDESARIAGEAVEFRRSAG